MTLEEWKENKEFQKAHEDYLETPAGQAYLSVLADESLATEAPATSSGEALIEANGLRGAELVGRAFIYRLSKRMARRAIAFAEQEANRKKEAPVETSLRGLRERRAQREAQPTNLP